MCMLKRTILPRNHDPRSRAVLIRKFITQRYEYPNLVEKATFSPKVFGTVHLGKTKIGATSFSLNEQFPRGSSK